MKTLALLLALIATPAMADQASDQVSLQIGRLVIQNTQCTLQVQALQAEVAKLKAGDKPADPKPAEKPAKP